MERLKRKHKSVRPIKVLQFGAGNFIRAYINWMIDILNEQTDFNGDALVIKPTAAGDYSALRLQDGLFHVLTKGIKKGMLIQNNHLVSCIQEVIHPYSEWDRYLESAQIPTIKIITSNTTEAGIRFNPDDNYEDKPAKEFPAKVTQWLHARWTYFDGDSDKGCIMLPCELIDQNGEQLQDTILQYCSHWNLSNSFIEWIKNHCQFCNTLVDRIVTGYPTLHAPELIQAFACEDKLMVDAEPYHLLVIEGPSDIKAELPFDQTNLNVIFTQDLQSYRDIKVKLLNGAHSGMVPVGYLAGMRTVREVIEHPELGHFITNLLFKNIIPSMDFPEDTLVNYAHEILDRFRNPFIDHQLIDISLNSISKFKTRLLPTLLAFTNKTGNAPAYICRALAALIVFYRGHYNGVTIALRDSDENITFFKTRWAQWNKDHNTSELVKSVLGHEQFWGQNLSIQNDLCSTVSENILHVLEQQTVS